MHPALHFLLHLHAQAEQPAGMAPSSHSGRLLRTHPPTCSVTASSTPLCSKPRSPRAPSCKTGSKESGQKCRRGKTSSENRQWRLAGTTVRPPSQPSSTGECSRYPCRPGKQPLVPLCTHQLNDCLGAQLRQLAHNSVQQRQQQPLVTVPAGSTGGVGLVPAGGEGRQRLQRGLMEARPARPAPASTGHGSGNSSSNSRASLPQLDDCCGDLAQAASIKGAGVLGGLQWGRKTEGRQAGRQREGVRLARVGS